MKIKIFIALFFSFVLLNFTGVNAKSLIFYVVPKMMQNPFYEPVAAGCAKAAEELEGTYSFDAESTQIIWNGFKATDKIKVVGQFKEFDSSRIGKQYASIEDLL